MSQRTGSRALPGDVEGYRAWAHEFDAWEDDAVAPVSEPLPTLPRHPLLTLVLLPEGVAHSRAAERSLESIRRQSYPRWEAWLEHGSGTHPEDERFRYLERGNSETCARWFNRVVDAAAGEYLLPVPPYALLAPHALQEFAAAITTLDSADLFYSDEDALDEAGLRMAPRFKPGWDTELMLGRNVVGHLAAYRTARLREVGGADPRLAASEAFLYDLALRTAAMADSHETRHIPAVLCSRPEETMRARGLDGQSARQVVASHLERIGEAGASVTAASNTPAWNRIIWPIPTPPPLVSVIVPTRDQPKLLSRCVQGVLDRTDYRNLELLIVDNGSVDPEAQGVTRRLGSVDRVRLLHDDAAFNFSSLNNRAARVASGAVLVFLNDDTAVIDGGWLRELVSQALRPEVGIVGARLLYPTNEVQHAGIILESGKPHHQFRSCDASDVGPNGELALTRSVTAVTAACIAVRKSVFDEVGGFDESLGIAFGDVDLCLRVAERGYRIVCTPFAELYHHESASRGYEDTAAKQGRLAQELGVLRERWGPHLFADRYANPNLLFGWDERGAWGLPRPVGQERGPHRRRHSLVDRVTLTLHTTRFLRAVAAALVPNPLFSPEWYLASYPEVASYRRGPYQHYRRHGIADGRNPNHMFDTAWYLDRYPDVAARGINPLDHYLRHGALEGRDPSPRFSTERYFAEHPDVRAAGQNPLLHYLLTRVDSAEDRARSSPVSKSAKP